MVVSVTGGLHTWARRPCWEVDGHFPGDWAVTRMAGATSRHPCHLRRGRADHAAPAVALAIVLLACFACGPGPGPLVGGNQHAATFTPPTAVPAIATLITTGTGVETRCTSSALQLAIGVGISEPTGQNTLSLALTNRSSTACVLFGYPAVTLLDGKGRALPFVYNHSGDQVVTGQPPTRVVLSPGETAFVAINKYRCDVGDQGLTSTVQLTPPANGMPLSVALAPPASRLTYCGPGDPGSVVAVSPVEPTFRDTLAH